MKIAVIGSRSLVVNNLEKYLPKDVDEIVSGGAIGIDRCAKEYAIRNNITLREFLPEYNKFGRSAPLKRNIEIIEYSDSVLAFWDGHSHGTLFVIKKCTEIKKPIRIFIKKINLRKNSGLQNFFKCLNINNRVSVL